MEDKTLKCPNCGATLDLNRLLSDAQRIDIENSRQAALKEFEQKLARERQQLARQMEQEKAAAIAASDKMYKELLEQKVKNEVEAAKLKLDTERAKETAALIELQKKLQTAELHQRVQQAEQEKQLEKARLEEKLRAEEQANRLKEDFEKEKAQMRKQLDRVQSAASTSVSQEVQGETQEDAVLSALSAWFPYDRFEEVKKGHVGADIVQTVCDVGGRPLGTIAYEVKNTKSYSNEWTEKLRQDMLTVGASLGILVSEALPAGAAKHGYLGIEKDTLFVCRPADLPVVTKLARMLVKTAAKSLAQQASVADRKEMIWQTVNSDRFKQTIIMLDGYFTKMKEDLEKHNKHNTLYYKKQNKRLGLLVAGLIEIETDFGVQLLDAKGRPLLEEQDEDEEE